jgi:hypothetical protein
MKNSKTSNLIFTIDVEDFKNNEQILDALVSAIQTSLDLNKDKDFGLSMRDKTNGFNIDLKNNIKVEIRNCNC